MNSSLMVAHTVDRLVHTELVSPFDLDKARLYVLPIVVETPTDDVVLVDEDENPYRLLRRTRHHAPVLAGCLVATGWCAPFDLDDDIQEVPPSSHPLRERVRLTVAISDMGIASVLRRSDRPDHVLPLPNRGMGDLPDVLEAWWSGS